MNRNKMIISVAAIILAIGGIVLFRNPSGDAVSDNMNTEMREGVITVNGQITCLPYRIATPGQECVKALKGDDGKTYAFNSLKVKGIENTMKEGDKVKAVGTFENAVSVDDSSVFRYDGVLVLRSLIKK